MRPSASVPSSLISHPPNRSTYLIWCPPRCEYPWPVSRDIPVTVVTQTRDKERLSPKPDRTRLCVARGFQIFEPVISEAGKRTNSETQQPRGDRGREYVQVPSMPVKDFAVHPRRTNPSVSSGLVSVDRYAVKRLLTRR